MPAVGLTEKHNHLCRGFSLVEIAIVLGVIGIIVGGIWAYAGQANENSKRQQLAEQMTTVVNNMHALYAGQASISGSIATPAGNPTVGTFAVCAWGGPATNGTCATNNAATQYFAVELSGLTMAQCINTIPPLSGSSGPPGLMDVVINGASIMNSATAGVTHSLPVQVKDAEAHCAAPSTADFVYRLRASNF